MKLSVVGQDERVVDLACEGKIAPLPTHLRGDPLTGFLDQARPGRAVLLDLSRSDYINSTGISWLIQAHKQLSRAGGQLVLHSLTSQVREALDLVDLSTVFKVAPDRSAALAALGLQLGA